METCSDPVKVLNRTITMSIAYRNGTFNLLKDLIYVKISYNVGGHWKRSLEHWGREVGTLMLGVK